MTLKASSWEAGDVGAVMRRDDFLLASTAQRDSSTSLSCTQTPYPALQSLSQAAHYRNPKTGNSRKNCSHSLGLNLFMTSTTCMWLLLQCCDIQYTQRDAPFLLRGLAWPPLPGRSERAVLRSKCSGLSGRHG